MSDFTPRKVHEAARETWTREQAIANGISTERLRRWARAGRLILVQVKTPPGAPCRYFANGIKRLLDEDLAAAAARRGIKPADPDGEIFPEASS